MTDGCDRFQILYVEDDDDAFEAWGERLEQLDTHRLEGNTKHEIVLTRARNRAEAHAAVEAAAEETGFDLVVLDLRYPVDSDSEPDEESFQGLQWLPELSERLPNATIVVFTAYITEQYMQHAVDAVARNGAHEYIPKSTPWREIESRLQRAWRFALLSREREALQRETVELLRSRTGRTHLVEAAADIGRRVDEMKKVAAGLDHLGEGAQRIGKVLRENLDALNQSMAGIVGGASARLREPRSVSNLGSWLRDSLFWYAGEFRNRNIALHWPIDPPVSVRSYVDDLRVVMHELLQNALCSIVATNRAGGRVGVTVSACHDLGVRIAVEDNGIGFADDDLRSERLFQRGHSNWPGEIQPVHHLGSGLNIIRTLVLNMGGSVSISNCVPTDRTQGARVELLIPILAPPAGEPR